MEYQKLSKNAKGVLVVTAVMQALFAISTAFLGAVLLKRNVFESLPLEIVGIVLLILGLVYCVVLPLFRHKRYRYLIKDDRIEIIEGVIFIRRTIVPIDRVYQIEISRGPIDNMFGVAKVVITTAGSTAAFRFLEILKAEDLAEQLHAYVKKKIQNNGGGQNV